MKESVISPINKARGNNRRVEMSYKNTEAKLKRVLDKLVSERSAFYTEKATFEKRCVANMNRMNELLEKLNTGNWRFVAKSLSNSHYFAETRYLDDEAICAKSARFDTIFAPIGFYLGSVRKSKNTEIIKQSIVASMFDCISSSNILRLDLLANTVLKSAEMVEYKITSDMCDEIFDILDETINDYADLTDGWYADNTTDIIAKIEDIIDQASQEWVEEGNLKVGMDFYTSRGPSKITKIVKTPSLTVTTEDGNDYILDRAKFAVMTTWKAYHSGLKIDELLYPLNGMED